MGLTELKNKLATIVPEIDFKLDERSTLDILNWLQEYAKKIPFDQEKKQFWDSFYFIQENSPEKLADIYQNVNKADGHLPPHQAFVLAFLNLLETTKVLFNTFPARHRDLYYRELLGLKPKSAQADNVALGITLNTDNAEYLIPKGTLFDAGQDSAGNPLQYASDADLLANQGKLTDLRWYRKDNDSWKSAILLSDSDNIELPENGIRLFSATPNDVRIQSANQTWDQANISSLTNDTFYLGFTDILPGQTLSLYWQLEGFEQFSISWFYLSKDNTWQPLTQLVHDQTRNLFDRGTLQTLLPQNASNQTSLMPTDKYWLKANMAPKIPSEKPPNYPRVKGLLYNAITATLINAETIESDHLLNGLAAGSIKQPVNTSVAISEIIQPWASWNGRPKEDEQTFLKRVPTRLSHRNRALNWDDIVTLLKERFVSIFDVKYPSTSELTKIPAPEKRQLIVIPDNRYKDNDDSLRPELNQARLTEMVEWLDQLSSPWTTIEIKNPTYVDVPINYELVFAPDVNPDYGRHQLQQELSRIYMPWGENTAIGVTPGNRIDYYQLLATIQQSPWVERVTSLTLKKGSPSTDAAGKSVEADDNEVLILVWNKTP
ncbi:hypothetical protein [Photorhabdus luminescens]|uniref:Baseplate protein J-like domain-containing protein n=1 Tax=Photorhabdus luminescens subsp. mexicana TaxID=2100167 RepID=A0A4V2X726_PHOLU|nr:hypothetical protein [Photorhabdus luminescens]TDB54375.1 hypothetical protein C5468_04190 [Photorhabdus luminescens subsp. mexicana]